MNMDHYRYVASTLIHVHAVRTSLHLSENLHVTMYLMTPRTICSEQAFQGVFVVE
jgi:hypothetical protein